MAEITHEQFRYGYTSGSFRIHVDMNRAGDFVMSQFGSKSRSIAHQFWTWTGLLLFAPATIVLLIFDWRLAIISFFMGMLINSAARKSAAQFVLENMLESEDFFVYVLLHGGATIFDANGNEVTSKLLSEIS